MADRNARRSSRVLLIGDVGTALRDVCNPDPHLCEVRDNVLDGIDAAARGAFDTIALVVESVAGQLGSVLRALRAGSSARIVLLARMCEEPIVRRWTTPTPGEEQLADEYCVCPVRLRTLLGSAGADQAAQVPQEPRLPEVGPSISTSPSSAPSGLEERRVRPLEWLATTDDLTGLKNRRYLREFGRQILDRARRTNGRVTILMFDIDNFKHYNDVYGHTTGDEILRQAAILMRRCCRRHDVVGRMGGDEFAVIFWDDPRRAGGDPRRDRRSAAGEHPTEALSVARRFQQAFGNTDLHLLGPRGEGVLTISGGLASFPRDGETVERLFDCADRALLEAKRSGKNRIYLVGEPQ
ncbi:MAG TPA: GGDEF domain-containing protein [Sedimentisphaerales bacterium]|jgi:diguanylate cyclase (GGDEF)-like protein|nr:GGDEF domain-containing protein [Sedimentisphaerales bacterium]HNU28226.1 GGDEF domain-containing protein [Sedimentisphaerales bacterium]